MRLTRPRATKLSQITIDADLAMGAHNITLEAGQTVGGIDFTLMIGWVLLDEILDTNTGSILDLDTGVITAMDLYMIIAHMRSNAADGILGCTINNLTDTKYHVKRIYNLTLDSFASKPYWNLFGAIPSGDSCGMILYIEGKKDVNGYPSFSAVPHARNYTTAYMALHGLYETDVGDITRLHIFSIANATGWIKIFGMNK